MRSLKNINIFRSCINRKLAVVMASLIIMGGLFGVYFIFSAAGAPVEVLGGNGSLDTTTQVNTFTLVNTTGTNTWALDTANKIAGAGSGRLRSPAGNGVSFNGYVYYRFTTTKVPKYVTLDLAYKKTWTGAQPAAGNWNVTAEIWEVGGAAPLQTITIDNGTANVNFVAMPTQTLTAITKMNTQYELRLKQQGLTGASSTGQLTAWFDEVKLNVTYDEQAPIPELAKAATDTAVDVVFDDTVDRVSAETLANYSLSPILAVSSAVLQADGKTVRLTTAKQARGTSYTITVNGVKDISGNTMTTARNVVFTGLDSTPPAVSTAAAADNKTVNVVFNEEVDWLTAEKLANYTFSPALSVSDATLQADKKTLRLTTSSQTGGTNYTVTVTGVEDISGNVIAGNNTAAFTGIQSADTVPPTVVSAAAVDNTTVDVVFSEQVDNTTARNPANYIINPALAVTAAAVQADGKTVRLTTTAQTGGTPYTVTVNQVKDTSGNTIGANNSAVFTGAAPPDTVPPTVVSARSVNNTTADVEFNEPVDAATAQDAANYAISPALAVTAAAVQADGKTVRLTTAGQAGGTGYTVTVTGVKDVSGNIIGVQNTASFTGTAPDTAPPAVISATAVSATRVDVVFSEKVEPLDAQKAANYTTTPLLTISDAVLQPDGKTVRLTTALQSVGATYSLTVANIRDLAGNLIGVNNTTTFTGSNIAVQSPHGSYLDDTNQCVKCHTTHNGLGVSLITQQTVTGLCYLCHDAAGLSKFDVASQFGKTAPFAASRHPVPDGNQQCTDCHNPHDGGKDALGNNIHWPRLLQNKVDKNIHSGNQFCLDCHKTAQGGTPPINAATFPADGKAHNNSAFNINGVQPFNPASGTNIRCLGCHEKHGSGAGPLLKVNINQDATMAEGNNKTFCYECHGGASADGRYKGKTVFDGVYSGHNRQAGSKTSVNYPGMTGQAGQCANCHDPHGTVNGTSKVAMKSLRGVYNDGKNNYTAADFDFCFQCHNSTSQDKAYNVQSDYNDATGGHRIKTAGGSLAVGSKLPCEDCHDIHGSANGNKYSMKDSLGSNLGDGRSECLTCHQNGKVVEGLTMSAPPAAVNEHTGGTTRCLDCHGKPHKVNKGVSGGGVDCLSCHKTIATAMKSTNGYHHMITSTAPDYTPASGKTCLTCHVDHNKFNNQKAFNLKANYVDSFLTSDTSAGQNTDFDALSGGLCLSCHKAQQLKTYAQANGSTVTQPISTSDYAYSAHNYTVASTFNDNTVFNANCSKCHNDNMTKDKQITANKFGTHDSGYSSILSNFGDTALTDPMDEKFCFKCHSSAGDVYGTPMSTVSKSVYDKYQSTGSRHDLTGGEPGAQEECVSCHGPHTVGKAKFADGLTVSDISDPDNTLRQFTKADGDMATWCIKCHDALPPVKTSTPMAYVPVSIQWPTAPITINASGYNKEVFKQSTHYTKAGMQCNNCHENHGSGSYNLWLYGEDTATGGICIRCHKGTDPAYPTAKNILADLQKGTSNNYRHPTLDITAGTKHNNKENFQNRPLTERHAECSDCHDPHSEVPNPPGTMAPAVPGPLKNISGVGVAYGTTPWSLAATYTFKSKIDNAYEICLKCHSYYSYGNTPPQPGTTNTTFDGRAQTDPSIEFNPNNAGYHAVIGESKAHTQHGAYVGTDRWGNPWTSASRMYCEDCHGSDDLTRQGPHGSSNKFILKRPYKPTTDKEAMNGTGADADSDQHLCFMCHDRQVYGGGSDTYGVTKTGFSGGGKNLHNYGSSSGSGKHAGRSCNACHSMVVHGSRLPHLLIDARYDPFPYNNNGKNQFAGFNGTYDQNIINTINSKTGKWTQSDCTHATCG